ncbi:class I SAM-dependent methyltransferase [Streptomyces sp. PTM05]|uniref:Class I SAM-dependent methyltransferase n=1 Tax=Streptantibioticus parmotrematis TaxID=2873249 RepID=A0ABS7QLN2_9ACTN|nr:class I SAM-dependent methyltransferase [Streptantibioticus parmotrematis]MBY8884093.1 class I SAM-dependent methyltransferase [Streptantibioticus parmotrematis]
MGAEDETHRLRAGSFGTVAEEYGRLRPAPCDEAVEWLVPKDRRTVLDLAAGAGTLTALLAERVPEVVAVEPDDRMRAVLAARRPDVRALRGTAESIPLTDGRVDAVVVSSAWHWFDAPRAVTEIARVLRPGGTLGVVWNGMDSSVPWVAEWQAGMRSGRPGNSGNSDARPQEQGRRFVARGERLREDIASGGPLFGEVEQATFSCVRSATPADVAALLGTYSRVILLPEEERRQLIAQAEELLRERLPEGEETLRVPFRSLCWRVTRL